MQVHPHKLFTAPTQSQRSTMDESQRDQNVLVVLWLCSRVCYRHSILGISTAASSVLVVSRLLLAEVTLNADWHPDSDVLHMSLCDFTELQ